jgi:hypothetical protein
MCIRLVFSPIADTFVCESVCLEDSRCNVNIDIDIDEGFRQQKHEVLKINYCKYSSTLSSLS